MRLQSFLPSPPYAASHSRQHFLQTTNPHRTLLLAPQTFPSVRYSIRKLKANFKALVALACTRLDLQLYVAYAIVESVAAAGCSLPLHLHRNEEEHLVVLARYLSDSLSKIMCSTLRSVPALPFQGDPGIVGGAPFVSVLESRTAARSPTVPSYHGALISCIFRTGRQR
jgi:hypothetical protein